MLTAEGATVIVYSRLLSFAPLAGAVSAPAPLRSAGAVSLLLLVSGGNMPSTLVNGDIWKVTVVSFLNVQEQLGLMDTHWSISSVVGTPDGLDLATAIDTTVGAVLKPFLPSVAAYAGCEAVRVLPAPVYDPDISIGSAGAGSFGATVLPPQCACILKLDTGMIGKSKRGRLYVPFPASGSLDPSGVISAGARTLLTAMGSALLGGIVVGAGGDTAVATLGVYSRKLSTIAEVTDIATPFGFATQRRRGFYGRSNIRPF